MSQLQNFLQCVTDFRALSASGSALDLPAQETLIEACHAILQADLVGNRAVQPHFWSVTAALETAFPLLLGPSLNAVRQKITSEDPDALAKAWILQGIQDGALCQAVEKLRSQPHILTAYKRIAPLRDSQTAAEICAALQSLQGLVVSTPQASGDQTSTSSVGAEKQSASGTILESHHAPNMELLEGEGKPIGIAATSQTAIVIEQMDKSTENDKLETQQPGGRAVLHTIGRLGKQVTGHLPTRLFPLHSSGASGVQSHQPRMEASTDKKLVAVSLACSESERVSVKLNVTEVPDFKAAFVSGLTQRAQGLMSGAAQTAQLPADSVQWLRSTAAMLPALPSWKGATSAPQNDLQPQSSQEAPAKPRQAQASEEQSSRPETEFLPSGIRPGQLDDGEAVLGGSTTSEKEVCKEEPRPTGGSRESPSDTQDDSLADKEIVSVRGAVDAEAQAGQTDPTCIIREPEVAIKTQISSTTQSSPSARPGWSVLSYFQPATGVSSHEGDQSTVEATQSRPSHASKRKTAAVVEAEHQLRQEGLELNEKLVGFAHHLLEATLAETQPLPLEDKRVTQFMTTVQQFLQHGLLTGDVSSRLWMPTWRSSSQGAILSLLQEIEKECLAGNSNSERPENVISWIKTKLIRQQLGQTLLLLHRGPDLLRKHYANEAIIRQEESGRVLGLLVSLDGAKFQSEGADGSGSAVLDFNAAEGLPGSNKVAPGLWSSVGSYFRQPENTQDKPQIARAEDPTTSNAGRRRRRLPRAVKIDDGGDSRGSTNSVTPVGMGTPNASFGVLSPLSSTELSAEPLSPTTMAFFKSLRIPSSLDPISSQDKAELEDLASSSFSPQFLAEILAQVPALQEDPPEPTGNEADLGSNSNFMNTLLQHNRGARHSESFTRAVDPISAARVLDTHAPGGFEKPRGTLDAEPDSSLLLDPQKPSSPPSDEGPSDASCQSFWQQGMEAAGEASSLPADVLREEGSGSLEVQDPDEDKTESFSQQDTSSGISQRKEATRPVTHSSADPLAAMEDGPHSESIQDLLAAKVTAEIFEDDSCALDTVDSILFRISESLDANISSQDSAEPRQEQQPFGTLEPPRVGQRIKLITKSQLLLPDSVALDLQGNVCVGCGASLQMASKPTKAHEVRRRCYYTGWIYCTECHDNSTAIIPAAVLSSWDFSRKSVCTMAKEFLQSIHEQALLRLHNSEPGLLEQVPSLAKAQEYRLKAAKALASARETSPEADVKVRRFLGALGMHSHLLENAEMWSLQDLYEISKGSSSELMTWLEKGSKKACSIATSALISSTDLQRSAS